MGCPVNTARRVLGPWFVHYRWHSGKLGPWAEERKGFQAGGIDPRPLGHPSAEEKCKYFTLYFPVYLSESSSQWPEV